MTVKEFDALDDFQRKIDALNDSIVTTTTSLVTNSKEEVVAFEVHCFIKGYYEESITILYDNLVRNTTEELARLDELYDRVIEN